MNLDEAKTELTTIVIAIGEYVSGKRKKRFKVMSNGTLREHDYESPEALFKYLTNRRVELEAFITSMTATSAPVFVQNKNIPMVFRK
jgi:ribosomal protein S18